MVRPPLRARTHRVVARGRRVCCSPTRGGDPEVAMARLLIETDDGQLVEVVDDIERYDLGFLPAAASLLTLIREAEKRAGIELKLT
jgi:hypothetical protein